VTCAQQSIGGWHGQGGWHLIVSGGILFFDHFMAQRSSRYLNSPCDA
jgi:hypothetical protein